jgi:chemotaxis protein MotB
MSDDHECDCPPEGLPAYMGTFADLMALLMCFFVLLLSFAEMDVLKFKQIAGSMKVAFGVQNKVRVRDIPKGTSIIAKEFSPGKPQPTVIEAVMQQTIDVTRETLDFDEAEEDENEGEGMDDKKGEGPGTDKANAEEKSTDEPKEKLADEPKEELTDEPKEKLTDEPKEKLTDEPKEKLTDEPKLSNEEILKQVQTAKGATEEAENLAQEIAGKMSKEILEGQVELLAKGSYVVIRIREKGSFGSASDTIESKFLPVIRKIEEILADTKGEIRVAGHTDSFPINDEYFRSNWELSGGRAASVIRELLKSGKLDKGRFVINGYADTKPIADNLTSEGRATNRRVEVIIVQGEQPDGVIVGVGINTLDPTEPLN